jgi:hypothetical protein
MREVLGLAAAAADVSALTEDHPSVDGAYLHLQLQQNAAV